MANWDVFFYTRGFNSIDSERSRRHLSKLLSYPITIASVLHENSPLTIRNQRLTKEGLRSLTALRQSLHASHNGVRQTGSPDSPSKAIRILIIGARAESTLPTDVWLQLTFLFPDMPFHLYFIGPEVTIPPLVGSPREHVHDSPFNHPSSTRVVNQSLSLTSIQAKYEDIHDTLQPFDPYNDVFFAFAPGFGFPSQTQVEPTVPAETMADSKAPIVHVPQSQTNWLGPILQILDTKCSLIATGFSPADVERDVLALDQTAGVAGEFEWCINPGANIFKSERLEVAEFDYRVMAQINWGIWAIKGKRYDVVEADHNRQDVYNIVESKQTGL